MKKIIDIIKTKQNSNFFNLLSANVLIQIVGLIAQIILTRILIVEDIGRIKILQSVLGILLLIGGSGLNVAILKLYSSNINKEIKKKYFITGFQLTLILSVATTLIFNFLVFINLFSNNNSFNQLLTFFSIQVPFLVINSYFIFYLQAQNKIIKISKIQLWIKIPLFTGTTLFAYYFGIYGFVWSSLLITIICTLIFLYSLKENIEIKKFYFNEISIIKKLINFGGLSFFSNLVSQVIITSNILFLAYFNVPSKDIGYYAIAQLIFSTLLIIPGTLNQVVLPKLSNTCDEEYEFNLNMKKYRKQMILIVVSMFIICFITLPILVPLIFGSEYSNSNILVNILLIGFLFWMIYSPKGIALVAMGKMNYNFLSSILVLVFNIGFNYILISKFQVVGAAIATVLTYFVSIFIYSYFYKKAIKSR